MACEKYIPKIDPEFGEIDFEKQDRVMRAVDAINQKHGRHTIRSARMGFTQAWKTKAQNLSKRYTTNFDELAIVHAK